MKRKNPYLFSHRMGFSCKCIRKYSSFIGLFSSLTHSTLPHVILIWWLIFMWLCCHVEEKVFASRTLILTRFLDVAFSCWMHALQNEVKNVRCAELSWAVCVWLKKYKSEKKLSPLFDNKMSSLLPSLFASIQKCWKCCTRLQQTKSNDAYFKIEWRYDIQPKWYSYRIRCVCTYGRNFSITCSVPFAFSFFLQKGKNW